MARSPRSFPLRFSCAGTKFSCLVERLVSHRDRTSSATQASPKEGGIVGEWCPEDQATLLFVDSYFLSSDGKRWPKLETLANGVGLVDNLRTSFTAVRVSSVFQSLSSRSIAVARLIRTLRSSHSGRAFFRPGGKVPPPTNCRTRETALPGIGNPVWLCRGTLPGP
jgi:hypothetical protein